MTNAVLNIIVRETDEEGLGTFHVIDIIQRHLPENGYIPEGKERDKLRKDIMKDVGRCIDMLLSDRASEIKIERDIR